MLKVVNLVKSYEGKPLLSGVSFEVASGETICLLGPSGSGKSTVLRIVAGLEEPEGGKVLWNGKDLASVPTHRRNFGLMFQDYALFPHRRVAENVAFGLRMQGLPAEEIEHKVQQALEMVNMASFAKRKVTDLSGGEQQRVALARAMAPRPRLLMLDEPLGALDRTLREELVEEVRHVLHQTHTPAIYVTHDQEEAFRVADRIAVLHDGLIQQNGPPAELYTNPASEWVAQFFGLGNVLPGKILSTDPLRVETSAGILQVICPGRHQSVGDVICLLVRPEGARVVDDPASTTEGQLKGNVIDVAFWGGSYRVTLTAGGRELRFQVPIAPQLGEKLVVQPATGAVQCLEGGRKSGDQRGEIEPNPAKIGVPLGS